MSTWLKTKYPGVRYREHATRKHGVQPDRYYTIVYKLDGKTREEGIGWASEGVKPAECAELLAKLKKQRKEGSGPRTLAEARETQRRTEEQRLKAEAHAKALAAREGITFDELFQQYLQAMAVTKKPRVLATDEGRYRNWIKPHLGAFPVRDITQDTLEQLQSAMLERKRSPLTIHHTLSLFRAVWNWGRKRGLLHGDNPYAIMDKIKAEGKRERFFSQEEVTAVLDWLKERDSAAWRLTLTAAHTGARLGELAQLTWERVDFTARQINFIHTKTGKPRSVPMTSTLYAMLASLTRGLPETPVLTQRDGAPWYTIKDGVLRTDTPFHFRQALKDLGLNEGYSQHSKLTFHCLRHMAATLLLRSGVDPRTVQELLGWSTLRMLERYAHVLSDTKRQAIAALDR